MNNFDLWEDETSGKAETITFPDVSPYEIVLKIYDDTIHLFSQQDLTTGDFINLLQYKFLETIDQVNHYTAKFSPINAFVLRKALKGYKSVIDPLDAKRMGKVADTIPQPKAFLTEDKKHVEIQVPYITTYKELLKKVDGYPTKNGFRINLTRVLDLEALSLSMESKLPKIQFDREVLLLNREPIIGFDGTVESLKELPLNSLHVVNVNNQTRKALKSSKQSIEEKMKSLGIENLYDLLFTLPRRYIDKSNPQDLSDLIPGETAVVVGTVHNIGNISSARGGVAFTIKTPKDDKIRVSFFNQNWLANKFNKGDEVLVTGKFSWFNRSPQISGASIEHASEVSVIPIVPVYKQSPSKGITTYLIMAANRELLSRLGTIKLPTYFRQEGRMNYCDALAELHFPSNLQKHQEAMNDLAYYELVYLQILIQQNKESSITHPGVPLTNDDRKLQAKAIKTLPFELTKSQKLGIVSLNKKMSESLPTTTLLNADVGAGKSILAQLACLKAVSSGYQAVLLGPTDILARQLYDGFIKLKNAMKRSFNEDIEIVFLGGTMKAAEKKIAQAKISSGEADIIVGTHAVLLVEYSNLGFVAIDEQQKFGAEQRSVLLNSRKDGAVPHTLIQSATPVPRSTAQVIYGDIDMIELTEKPPGRIPIITEWIQEDPNEIIDYTTDEIWMDIIKESSKGNQTFIITPLVSESTSIDSASVERTFKSLSQLALSSLKVGYVHGKMKQIDQAKVMEDFRNKEYDVLVASTVVEVGVDIPDATRVVILSADRLGSSQLHQIRGRVGRNSKPSKCYLVSLGKTDNSQKRLRSLVKFDNGFDIAKSDLEIRGEGKMFGTEQSGRSEMIFANLQKHAEKIQEAKEEAQRIMKSPFKEQALQDSINKFNSQERFI